MSPAPSRVPRKVLVVANLAKPGAEKLTGELRSWLEARSIGTTLCSYHGACPEIPDGDFDLAACLGGDGTVLFCARRLAPRGIPVFPINIGTLGFLAEVGPEDWSESLRMYLEGKLEATGRLLLEVRVEKTDGSTIIMNALNEASLTCTGPARLITFQATVIAKNGQERRENLGLYRADGVLVATPTGSTAYSLAAGGPILSPDVDAIIFTPLAPFTLSNRPVVLPSTRTLEISLPAQKTGVVLTFDGQESLPLAEGDRYYCSASAHRAMIIPSGKLAFYDILRTKLGWSGGSVASEGAGGTDA